MSDNEAETTQASEGGEDETADFIASEKFDGAREGYKFENGSQGVGYYRDRGPAASAINLQTFETEDTPHHPHDEPYEEEVEKAVGKEEEAAEEGGDRGLLWALGRNFMADSPTWYKQAVAGFLVLNLVLGFAAGKKLAAWAVLLEFIFTLAMATACYPLQPGGLIVLEGYAMGLAPAERLEFEVEHNIDILLLVIFMVACVHFLKNLLLWIFTNLLIKVESKVALSVGLMLVSALMSAFMDALSVSAVLISVCSGVLGIYYQAVAKTGLPEIEAGVHHDTMEFELVPHHNHSHMVKAKDIDIVKDESLNPLAEDESASPTAVPKYATTDHAQGEEMMFPGAPMQDGPKVVEPDGESADLHKEDILQFRDFLRSVLMHGAVGTAIGGCTTLVGEPQNLVIAKRLGWDFIEFAEAMAPITIIVWPAGIVTCILVELYGGDGYGSQMPPHVRMVLREFVDDQYGQLHSLERAELLVQTVGAVFLVVALCAHLTEVGFVGLGVAIFVTTMNGECEEHDIAHAFLEAMPFVSLLVVFFGVVAIIEEQHLFAPIINAVLALDTAQQPVALYIVNGVLSMVSDNVFVATIFIESVSDACGGDPVTKMCVPTGDDNLAGNMTWAHFEDLAVAINMGTNLPSCATPNGQAAFLFILTSTVAPLVQLTYLKMVRMTMPYTITLSIAGLVGILTMDMHE